MASNVRDIFSSHLRYLLDHKGKSQIDMARDLGVATGTVSSWVNGQKFPRADTIERISIYLGVRMSTLVEEGGLDSFLREEDDSHLLYAFHSADPSIQAAIRKLLDLADPKEKNSESPAM